MPRRRNISDITDILPLFLSAHNSAPSKFLKGHGDGEDINVLCIMRSPPDILWEPPPRNQRVVFLIKYTFLKLWSLVWRLQAEATLALLGHPLMRWTNAWLRTTPRGIHRIGYEKLGTPKSWRGGILSFIWFFHSWCVTSISCFRILSSSFWWSKMRRTSFNYYQSLNKSLIGLNKINPTGEGAV